MKTYNVELKYESYVTICVEAEHRGEAQDVAIEEIINDGSYGSRGGNWTVESTREIL